MTRNYRVGAVRVAHHEHVVDVLDNGHTIQVTYDEGSTVELAGKSYGLVQYHFHSPSEHTVDGEHFPMEIHFVHRSEDGELAVLGVLVEAGAHNPTFDAIWNDLPREPGESRHLEQVDVDIDELFPESHERYRYEGSLTTPPCSEGVHWSVIREALSLSQEQIEAFRSIFDANNRPVQPIHDRRVQIFTDGPTDQ